MSAINAAQQQALEHAYRILSEHFDDSLIVIGTQSDQATPDGGQGDAIQVFWAGGYLSALGMCEKARHVILGAGSMPENLP